MGNTLTKVNQENTNHAKKMEVKNCLVQQESDPYHVSPDGKNLLHLSAENGNVDMVTILLAKGIDPATVDKIQQNPLHLAARHGHTEIMKLLLAHDHTLHKTVTLTGYAALHLASEKGHVEAVKLLLAQGADVNQAVTNRKYTPLHLAVEQGQTTVVELLLLQKNINIDSLTNANRTPLFAASWLGYDLIVAMLLKNGANLNQADTAGDTALSIAMKSKHNKVIKLLVDKGCNSIDTTNSVTKVSSSSKIGVTHRSRIMFQ